MITTKPKGRTVRELLDDIYARSWSGWSAHFMVYLFYMFLQVTLFDSLSGFMGMASRVVALVLLALVFIHAALLYVHDWRLAHKRKLSDGEDEKPKRVLVDADGELLDMADDPDERQQVRKVK